MNLDLDVDVRILLIQNNLSQNNRSKEVYACHEPKVYFDVHPAVSQDRGQLPNVQSPETDDYDHGAQILNAERQKTGDLKRVDVLKFLKINHEIPSRDGAPVLTIDEWMLGVEYLKKNKS